MGDNIENKLNKMLMARLKIKHGENRVLSTEGPNRSHFQAFYRKWINLQNNKDNKEE